MTAPGQVSLAQATPATPVTAPVNDPPLPPVVRAGVYLTWGVLGLITLFLSVMMGYLWSKEPAGGLPAFGVVRDTLGLRLRAADQTAFRDFWLKILQMVLLNVLLPVLTALLGYVFATQRERATKEQ